MSTVNRQLLGSQISLYTILHVSEHRVDIGCIENSWRLVLEKNGEHVSMYELQGLEILFCELVRHRSTQEVITYQGVIKRHETSNVWLYNGNVEHFWYSLGEQRVFQLKFSQLLCDSLPSFGKYFDLILALGEEFISISHGDWLVSVIQSELVLWL